MKIDLSKNEYNDNNEIIIDKKLVLDKEYYDSTEIRKISEVSIKGKIRDEGEGAYSIHLTINGEMVLPCAISLNDVLYPFDIKIDEIIDPTEEESEDYLKIINNTIDIMPIIWQNIVVEIPMRVVSPEFENVKLEGDGWKLLSEEEKMKELDPRLQKLRDLLDD